MVVVEAFFYYSSSAIHLHRRSTDPFSVGPSLNIIREKFVENLILYPSIRRRRVPRMNSTCYPHSVKHINNTPALRRQLCFMIIFWKLILWIVLVRLCKCGGMFPLWRRTSSFFCGPKLDYSFFFERDANWCATIFSRATFMDTPILAKS